MKRIFAVRNEEAVQFSAIQKKIHPTPLLQKGATDEKRSHPSLLKEEATNLRYTATSFVKGGLGGIFLRAFPRFRQRAGTHNFHLLCLLTASIVGIRTVWAQPQPHPVPVVASFSILGDMVAQIGGEDVSITTLVGANSDAHVYQPTPSDVQAITRARLVVMNGLGFEGWMPRLLTSAGYKGEAAVASTGITPRHDDGAPDPHLWQDLAQGQRYVATITEALVKVDPAREKAYRQRAMAYTAELQATDQWVRAQWATLPPAQRKVITPHEAFGYFGAAYGVTFLAPAGWNAESEPSAKGVAQLIAQIKREKVRALFVENMRDPRLLRRIAEDTGTQIGGQLFSDALAPKGHVADNYIGLFKHNVATLMAGFHTTSTHP